MNSWLALCLASAWLSMATAARPDVVLKVVRETATAANLLQNPAFEQQRDGQFLAWSSAPQGMRVAAREGRNQSVALACDAGDEKSWCGASQTLVLNRSTIAPVLVRAWSKAAQVSGSSGSGYALYVDLVYRDGTTLWGRTAPFRTGTHDWEQQELRILPDKPIQRLTLHCIFRGHSGHAWFDDVQVVEVETPQGAVLFQGTPVVVVASSQQADGEVSRHTTSDGLSLELTSGQVTRLDVSGRELAASAPSGFLARDVAANSDFLSFSNGVCAKLGLRLETTIVAKSNHLVVEGQVRDTTGRDRAVLLAFALPIDAAGWMWGDDIRRARMIEGRAEFSNLVAVNSGSTGMQSVYPLGSVSDPGSGLALALDMAHPAQYRLAYHAGTKQLLIAYDFGLVPESERFPSGARFRFVLYSFNPRWGFRGAVQKLMEIFPDYFAVRSTQQGIWMPFTDVSRVEGWQDFGFRYHEGNNNVPFDDAHQVLSFRYTEPMTWWMRMAPELPRDLPTALRIREQYAQGRSESQRRMAEVSRVAAMHDLDGQPALLFRNEPWANGAVWSLNPNPLLPAKPNAATVHWNPRLKEQLYGSETKGVLDGEYLDSLEGYVTAELNFRRDHFRATTVPLTFATGTFQPALSKGLAVFEFTRWISEDLHRLGKLTFANGVPYRFTFLCPWLDVMGTETDWLPGGRYRPAAHSQMALWRTLAGPKPYLLLLNTDYERFGPELVERYFARSLFYGMFPSMFSHNASENPYWRNPKWYNRDRPLFKRFIPLIKEVAEAGWQPVTSALSDNDQLLVERFGPAPDGTVYYTVFNDSASPQKALIRETSETPAAQNRTRAATELLRGTSLPADGSGWPVELEPERVAVLRVR